MSLPKPKPSELQRRLRAAYPDARCALDHGDPFQLVVATILSAQCTDARVNLTTPALFARFPDAASLAEAPLEELEGLIRSTGFYHNKAKNLIGLGQALRARHGGVVPSDPAALGALPGVGQKTANVVLANAFGVPALAVDTHIFRVARRLFAREDWIELHHQLIFHGRRVCDARRPDCGACTLLDLCPTGLGKVKDPHLGVKLQAPAPGLPASAINPPPPTSSGTLRIVSLVPFGLGQEKPHHFRAHRRGHQGSRPRPHPGPGA